MAQHDYDINSSDAISGLQFRQDLNTVLSAIKSSNSGAIAPTSYVSGTLWLDTSTTPNQLKLRNKADTAWDIIPIESVMGANIASATTTTIGTFASGNIAHITGTVAITSFGVSTTGTRRALVFDSALTITHNATSLILPNGTNITTIAGDVAEFECEDGALGYWRLISYSNMASLIHSATSKTIPIDADEIVITDSASSFVIKKLTWANLKSSLPQRRNYLINGNFKINERAYVSGTATVVANQYIFDRWYIPTTGESATFTTTNGIVTVIAPASGIVQKVENTSNNGGTITLSNMGTATLTVTESTDNVTYTTVTVVNGTFTPAAGKYIKITLASGTVSLVKLEDGSVVTNGWHPYDGEFGGEVQACQRYLPSFAGIHGFMGYSVNTIYSYIAFPFNTKARVSPTGISINNLSNISIINGSGILGVPTAAVIKDGGVSTLVCNFTTTPGSPTLTAGQGAELTCNSNTLILFTGCEL